MSNNSADVSLEILEKSGLSVATLSRLMKISESSIKRCII